MTLPLPRTAIQALQIAVDDEDQVIEPSRKGSVIEPSIPARHFPSPKMPKLARRRGMIPRLSRYRMKRPVDGVDRPKPIRDLGEAPEIRHEHGADTTAALVFRATHGGILQCSSLSRPSKTPAVDAGEAGPGIDQVAGLIAVYFAWKK